MAEHENRGFARDLQWRAKDIFVGHHVADDQHAFAGELAGETRQPIALGSSSHEDDFLTLKGASAGAPPRHTMP